MKEKKGKIKFLTIARNVFATISIIHILAILIWFMTPREQIISFAQKSFYPPFIKSYYTKYEDTKEVYTKAKELYEKGNISTNKYAEAQVNFEGSENTLIMMSFVNIFIMTIILVIIWLVINEARSKIINKRV